MLLIEYKKEEAKCNSLQNECNVFKTQINRLLEDLKIKDKKLTTLEQTYKEQLNSEIFKLERDLDIKDKSFSECITKINQLKDENKDKDNHIKDLETTIQLIRQNVLFNIIYRMNNYKMLQKR